MTASYLCIAYEVDFAPFPQNGFRLPRYEWVYVVESSSESLTMPVYMYNKDLRPDSVARSFQRFLIEDGAESELNGKIVTVYRYKGAPVTKVEYRSAGPVPIIRPTIRLRPQPIKN